MGRGGLSLSSTWDVDGLCDLKVTLEPGHHEMLALEIPLRAERAALMHACVDGLRHNYGGVVPSGQGRVWDGSKALGRRDLVGDYVPYLWVGGPLRGFAVFGDNDRGWVTGGEGMGNKEEGRGKNIPCQEIIRENDGTVVIRLNLVQRAVDLTEPRTIRIGLQATPVKPMPENWRSRSIGTLIAGTRCWGGLGGVETADGTDRFFRKMAETRRTGKVDTEFLKDFLRVTPLEGAPGSPEREADLADQSHHHRSGMNWMKIGSQMADFKPVFYTNARGVEYGNQSGLTYLDEWSRVAWKDRNVTRRTHEDYELDPVASYRDYALWNYKKMFDSGACDAIYWDDVYACANFDLVGTDAYRLSSGRIQPSVGIFNMRALIRRCAVLQTELGHDCRDNWVHMTNTEIAPVCGFAGVNYDWEDVCGDSPIQERYSRETIQACSLGRQMGNRVAVIGYFSTKDRSSDKLKWLERTGTGACLTHELAWLRVSYWKTEYRKLVEWGYGLPTTRVWNYWSEDEEFPFEIQGPKNAALAMQRADGKMLLIVSDWECGGIYTVRSRQSDFQTTFELAKFDYKILEVER